MTVLWLTNIPLPLYNEIKQVEGTHLGGWLDVMSRQISEKNNFVSVFPSDRHIEEKSKRISFYSFEKGNKNIAYFQRIIQIEQPNIIHIWGTEFEHTYEMVIASKKEKIINHTVISIQGSSFFWGKFHYYAGLPPMTIMGYSFRDLLKKDNIITEKKLFEMRGEWELEAIRCSENVIGRTTWDYAITRLINPNITYYQCDEILRESFYKAKWNLDNCERHRIFMSQGQYPVKGLHMMIEALYILKRFYPDVQLKVAGIDFLKVPFYRRTNYQNYILHLIKTKKVTSNIKFVGILNESKMIEEYKRANVFVSASSIENSSNSIGEAMIMGCPCVASNVGGTSDMLKDKVEGYLYPFNEPYMLAHYIRNIFESDELASSFSQKSREHAFERHDVDNNYNRMMKIYYSLIRE